MRTGLAWFAAATLVVGFVSTAAAEGDGRPSLSYGASASYTLDINDPKAQSDADPLNANPGAYASLEQDESFNIDLVQFGMSGQRGRVGYSAKLDLGDLAAKVGDSADGDIALQEAYLTLDGGSIRSRVGRFATPIGYEVVEPWGNAHISRSWGWLMQPINHDGITLDGQFDSVDFSVGVVNSFSVGDSAANDVDDEKGIIASFGAGVSDQINIYVSGIYSEERDVDEVGLVNGILSGILGPGGAGLRYALEGNYVEHDFSSGSEASGWNVGVYGGTDMGPLGLDVRWDYSDFSGDAGSSTPTFVAGGGGGSNSDAFGLDWSSIAASGLDTDIWSVTVTGSVALADAVEFRIEYRHDDSGANVFLDDDASNDTLDVVQAQVVWHPAGN